MMRILLGIVCLAQTCFLQAQFFEDFNDGRFDSDTTWLGMKYAFQEKNGFLQSKFDTANSHFFISKEISVLKSCQWTIEFELSFNTSSLNYLDFVLLSDTINPILSQNMVYVRIGGSKDEISLYKKENVFAIKAKVILLSMSFIRMIPCNCCGDKM
jgi:hypothetical protein